MSNHWLLAIGINQYLHFPSLSYGQADAQALWNFLVGKASFMPDRCLLLTDTSPFIERESSYPTKANIHKWIDWLSKGRQGSGSSIQPGDVIWCFFSGYGINWEGQDYLMPIDGNPAHVSNTGLSVRSLFESLQATSAANIMVLLDLHPSHSGAGASVGDQTLQLAREMEIPTVLSTQPGQGSSESAEMHQGLFTKALLEGLKSGTVATVGDLTKDLKQRLPKLCEQYARPKQEPALVVNPSEKMHQAILPPNAVAVANNSRSGSEQNNSSPAAVGANLSPSLAAVRQHMQNVSTIPGTSNPFEEALNKSDSSLVNAPGETPTPLYPPAGNVPARSSNDSPQQDSGSFWQRLLLWAGGALLVLLVLVSIFGRNRLVSRQGAGDSPNGTVPTLSSAGSPERQNQARLNQAAGLLRENQVSQFSKAIALASQIKPNEPLYDQAQESIARWSEVILDTAKGRAQRGNFEAAIAAAQLIPKDQPSYDEAQKLAGGWRTSLKQQQINKNLLQASRALIRPEQASSYNQAIDLARQVPVGQPGYAEAKQAIAQWSQSILTLAQARASEGFINAAIQTASLVPENTPAYPKAKAAIAQWKRQLKP